jgi:LEA14-like dessication related protein
MMKLLKSKYFIAGLTIFLVGFIVAQTVRLPKFNSVENFTIHSFSGGVMMSDAVFKVENPNWFSYNGKDLKCLVFFQGKQIATGERPDKFNLRRKTISDLSMRMTFYADSLENKLRDILMQDSISLDITISGKFFLGIRKSEEMHVTIPTKELVNSLVGDLMGDDGIGLERIRLKEVGLEQSTFDVAFNFSNKLPFDLLLQRMTIQVYHDKSHSLKLATWNFDVAKQIRSGQSELISGESVVKNKESVVTGIIKVVTGELDYYLSGHASLSVDGREIRIPVEQHIRVFPLSKKVIVVE